MKRQDKQPDRWLATVLFTDIVGSTERAAELGDRAWRELLQRHHALVRRELERFGGRELNMTGDGFLASFEVPERAIRCAWAIRDAVRGLGMEIRCGLHTGEVEVVEETVGGIAVHIGARVAAQAKAGEVLVSSTVHDLVTGSGFGFEDRGSHALKGVPGEWRLFAVTSAPVRLPVSEIRSRVKEARLARVVLIYLAACAAVLWLTVYLRGELHLPAWTLPLAVVLLLIGLVVLTATAWVQSHPLTAARAEREELPGSWELDLGDVGKSVARGRLPHLTWARAILGGVFAFSLLFGLAGLYVVVKDRGRSFSPEEAIAGDAAPGIAVLPFHVSGPGLDQWREGMVDLLSTNLDGVAGLRTIDSRTVLAGWRERLPDAGAANLETALEVARRTGARYALVGNAVASQSGLRLTADVYEIESGEELGQGQVEGSADSVFTLVDKLSIEVLRAILKGDARELPKVNLARVTTSSLPALKAYLEGEVLFRRSDFDGAIPAYHRAVEADSTFALALYRLSFAYGWSEGIQSDLAAQSIERAGRFAGRLPEREALLVRAGLALQHGTLEGLEPLRQAVRKYPDDPEAWYLLADTHFHLGDQALLPAEESDRAFGRAIELDPSFAPAYIHLVGNAFWQADSARADSLVEAYGRVATGSLTDRSNRFAFELAFADSTGRERARAAMDTLSLLVLAGVRQHLWHPAFLTAQDELRSELQQRPDYTGKQLNTFVLSIVNTNRGKLQRMLALLDEPVLGHEFVREVAYVAHVAGVAIPAERLDRVLAPSAADSNPDFSVFFVGAYAAEQGRWFDHAEALAGMRGLSQLQLVEGDSTGARVAEAAAKALEGYAAWKRGEVEEAASLLEATRPRATGHGPERPINLTIRWWLARLYMEAGRWREAERYLASFRVDPLAAFELGKVYEELEEYAKARESYQYFLTAWAEADPELQPKVEEARAAVGRLTSVIRE